MTLVPRSTGKDAEPVRNALVDGFVVSIGDDDQRMGAIIDRRLPFALIDHAPNTAG